MSPVVIAPAAKSGGHRFLMLDLMRGIAAISVLIYHAYHANFLSFQPLPNAYLAVDLFFLLSGFVIAHNYDAKIAAGMSFREFLVQRLIRLYPCLLLALALGIVVSCLRMARYEGFLDGWRIVASAGLNALFLPAITQPYGTWGYFPFNGAAWSLTFELIANILYWLTFRHLGPARLGMLVLAAAAGIIFFAAAHGSMDFGMRPSDFWWGVPRVTLTFFAGVALRRHVYGRTAPELGVLAVPFTLLSLLLAFSLSRFVSTQYMPLAEILTVAVFFPLLLVLTGSSTPGPGAAAICKWTGDASYPVYLLQTPLLGVFAAIPQLWGVKAGNLIPWIGIAYIAGTIVIALWVDRYYEWPARRLLKDRWQKLRLAVQPDTRKSVKSH